MKKLLIFITIIALAITASVTILTGCVGPLGTIGNGKVDIIEGAVFKLAVSAAIDAKPELAQPALAVSDALLELMTDDRQVSLTTLDAAVGDRLAELDLSPVVDKAFAMLVSDIRDNIIDHVAESDTNASTAVVVVRDLIQIVNAVARSHLHG